MIATAPWVFSAGLALLLWAAAIHDVRTFTIPHSYTYAVLALLALLVMVSLMAGTDGPFIARSLLGGLVALVVGFVMYTLRVMGAGDVKIFAATAPFFPLSAVGWVFALVAVCGLVWTLAYVAGRLAAKRLATGRGDGGGLAAVRRMRVPYGPAIAGGVTLALLGAALGPGSGARII